MIIYSERKKWVGCLVSLLMPGLGQVYSGELLRGACFLVFFVFSPLLLVSLTVLLSDQFLLPGIALSVVLAIVCYLWALIDSWRLIHRGGKFYQLRSYNSPFFYLAVWLVGIVMILVSDQYLRANAVEAYKIVGQSMIPTVLPGDYVLVKKPAYRNRPVQKGDIVIAIYPDNRGMSLIRQITALPGEQIYNEDGSSFIVPHGTVIVKGTSRNAVDSTTFGPLDLRDVVGRVTQIYFSREGLAVRWPRIATFVKG